MLQRNSIELYNGAVLLNNINVAQSISLPFRCEDKFSVF